MGTKRSKILLRVGGTLAAAVGLLCLPVGLRVNPKRDLSLFSNLADLGAFGQTGLALLFVGLMAVALSYVVPGEMDD